MSGGRNPRTCLSFSWTVGIFQRKRTGSGSVPSINTKERGMKKALIIIITAAFIFTCSVPARAQVGTAAQVAVKATTRSLSAMRAAASSNVLSTPPEKATPKDDILLNIFTSLVFFVSKSRCCAFILEYLSVIGILRHETTLAGKKGLQSISDTL